MLELIGYGICLIAALIALLILTTSNLRETPVAGVIAVVGVVLAFILALNINAQAERFNNAISVGSGLTVADTLPYDAGPDGLQ